MTSRRAGAETAPKAPPDKSAADLEASIAEHAVRLAHLFCERARMFHADGETAAAVRDKSRAEHLYKWGVQAAQSTNHAGQDVLRPELEQLKTELDSFQLSKAAIAR